MIYVLTVVMVLMFQNVCVGLEYKSESVKEEKFEIIKMKLEKNNNEILSDSVILSRFGYEIFSMNKKPENYFYEIKPKDKLFYIREEVFPNKIYDNNDFLKKIIEILQEYYPEANKLNRDVLKNLTLNEIDLIYIKINTKNIIDSIKLLKSSKSQNSLITNINTNKKSSLFHNSIQLETNLNEGCFFVYDHLNHNHYIERLEANKILGELYDYLEIDASKEIDQELSSEISSQYYFSMIFCKNNSESNNVSINIPIHLRYQAATTNKIYENVRLAVPFIKKLNSPLSNKDISNETEEYILNKIEQNDYINDLEKIYLMDKYNDELTQQFPVGNKDHLPIITITTIFTTLIGFIIILKSLIKFSFN